MRKKGRRSAYTPGGGNGDTGKKSIIRFIAVFKPSKTRASNAIHLPDWLFSALCKIQSAWGIPLDTLVIDPLADFVCESWDFKNDKPKRTGA